ncbi:MAG TPA: hypothetical protein VL461_04355 [Dictyobacter sp.]|nr:hypothetical protein [Dictyobacter sp.]
MKTISRNRHVLLQVSSGKQLHTPGLLLRYLFFCLLPLGLLLSSCTSNASTDKTITNSAAQSITYNTAATGVVIRTFYGGGMYGSLSLAPQISIYGNGTYILGTQKQGKLNNNQFQSLLTTLVNTDGLLNLKRQQFSDLPDQNTTFLELTLNNQTHEFQYGSFGNQQETAQDLNDYKQLGNALTTITQTVNDPTKSYQSNTDALLVRQIFSYDLTQAIPTWSDSTLTLNQTATLECGNVSTTDLDINKESGCLKYTIPTKAIEITNHQTQIVKNLLHLQPDGTMQEDGSYFNVQLRMLLPDEIATKKLAMFGSNQQSYQAIPLQQSAS